MPLQISVDFIVTDRKANTFTEVLRLYDNI